MGLSRAIHLPLEGLPRGHSQWRASQLLPLPIPTLPAAGLEPLELESRAAVHRAPGSRESHSLVPTSAWAVGIRRRHG